MAADAVSGDLGVWQEDEGRQIVANAVKLAKEAVGADRKLSVKSELVFSTPVPTMVEISNEAEMVVLGSSGRGALARGLLGSVSSSLVRRAGCPVAVIHSDDAVILIRSTLPCWWESTVRRFRSLRRRWHLTRRRAAASN